MAVNKINYDRKTLIDLTQDTVSESSLLSGYTAHMKDGTVISGKLLADHPEQFEVMDSIVDSAGKTVTDSSGGTVQGAVVYRKI